LGLAAGGERVEPGKRLGTATLSDTRRV